MLNLIRMNLYRMTKTKSLYILLICSLSFCLLSCYMDQEDFVEMHMGETETTTEETSSEDKKTDSTSENTLPEDEGTESINENTGSNGITIEKVEEIDPEEGSFGIAVQTPEKTDGKNPVFLEYFHAHLASGMLLLFLIIGTALYVNGESKCGFIKNIAGQTRHKSYIYIAKIIALAIYAAFSMLAYELVHYIGLKLFLPYKLSFGKEYLDQSAKLLLVTFLLYLAFVSAIALLVTLSHSTSLGITVGILVDCGFLLLFIPYLEKLFHVKIMKYLITTNMQQLLLDASGKCIQRCIYVGGIFLLIYLLCGTVYFTKKDVV